LEFCEGCTSRESHRTARQGQYWRCLVVLWLSPYRRVIVSYWKGHITARQSKYWRRMAVLWLPRKESNCFLFERQQNSLTEPVLALSGCSVAFPIRKRHCGVYPKYPWECWGVSMPWAGENRGRIKHLMLKGPANFRGRRNNGGRQNAHPKPGRSEGVLVAFAPRVSSP